MAQLAVPLSLPRERLIDRLPGLGEHGSQQLMGDAANRFLATVAVDRLRLVVPEPDPTLDRITHDHRVMGQLQQLAPQPQLLLVALALGDIARRHHQVLAHRRDHRVDHPRGEQRPGPRPLAVDRIGTAGLAGLGHPAVDREPVTPRELRKQLPEAMTEQPLAVKANQRAIGVIDVFMAKIDDLAARTANR